MIQAHPRIGSGLLCPVTFTAAFIGPSILAFQVGGLPLVFGMTIFAGLSEMAMVPVLKRLRWLIPPELSGLVLFLVALTILAIAVRNITSLRISEHTVAAYRTLGITFGVIAALSVWGRGQVRLFAVLAGMVLGYLFAWHDGILSEVEKTSILTQPWLALPRTEHIAFAFDATMVVPYLIAALVCCTKAAGLVTMARKSSPDAAASAENDTVARGVFADGLGTAFSGLVGTLGINSAATAVGLVAATRIASRNVAWAIGTICVALAFLPQLGYSLAHLPTAVLGGMLIFTGSFVLTSGMQIIIESKLDNRKTLVIGIAVFAALMVELQPELIRDIPTFLLPITGSSLVFGTVVGVLVNLLFRIGAMKRKVLKIDLSQAQDITEFPDWSKGMPPGAVPVLRNMLNGIIQQNISGPVMLRFWTDDYAFKARISYLGRPPDFAAAGRRGAFAQEHKLARLRARANGAEAVVSFGFSL
jgi:NCS2 family nucleobase:cation symporter-2